MVTSSAGGGVPLETSTEVIGVLCSQTYYLIGDLHNTYIYIHTHISISYIHILDII